MSKLSDSIRRASRVEPAPLGFAAAAARKPAPTLLCVVRLSRGDAAKAEEAAKKGASGFIVEGLDAGKAAEFVKKAAGAFVGADVRDASRKDVAALRNAGADFAVFRLDSGAEGLLEESVGLVMALDGPAEDTTLRLLGEIGLDALIVPGPGAKLSVEELLGFRRLAALSRTPLLTEVKVDADAELLQALRDAGVAGVIVDAGAVGRLEGLSQRIAELPERGRKKEERPEPLVPAGAVTGGDHEHEDDD